MPITSNFNANRAMNQMMRFQNMARLKSSRPSIKNIKQEQVEVSGDLTQYAKGSRYIPDIIAAIQAGRGRIQNREFGVSEDGSLLPSGVNPSRIPKDYQRPLDDQNRIQNEARSDNIREHAIEEYAKQVELQKPESEPLHENVPPELQSVSTVQTQSNEASSGQIIDVKA